MVGDATVSLCKDPIVGEQSSDRTDSTGSPAELGPRVLARVIDSGVLLLAFLIVVIPNLMVGNFGGTLDLDDGFGAFSGPRFFVTLGWSLVIMAYFVLMESACGQTVGKMVMKLETQGPDGNRPSLEMAINRNLWNALGIIPVIGGMVQLGAVVSIAITIGQSATRTGWHDRFAGGTRVMQRAVMQRAVMQRAVIQRAVDGA